MPVCRSVRWPSFVCTVTDFCGLVTDLAALKFITPDIQHIYRDAIPPALLSYLLNTVGHFDSVYRVQQHHFVVHDLALITPS